jgi:hypothetical protein
MAQKYDEVDTFTPQNSAAACVGVLFAAAPPGKIFLHICPHWSNF